MGAGHRDRARGVGVELLRHPRVPSGRRAAVRGAHPGAASGSAASRGVPAAAARVVVVEVARPRHAQRRRVLRADLPGRTAAANQHRRDGHGDLAGRDDAVRLARPVRPAPRPAPRWRRRRARRRCADVVLRHGGRRPPWGHRLDRGDGHVLVRLRARETVGQRRRRTVADRVAAGRGRARTVAGRRRHRGRPACARPAGTHRVRLRRGRGNRNRVRRVVRRAPPPRRRDRRAGRTAQPGDRRPARHGRRRRSVDRPPAVWSRVGAGGHPARVAAPATGRPTPRSGAAPSSAPPGSARGAAGPGRRRRPPPPCPGGSRRRRCSYACGRATRRG